MTSLPKELFIELLTYDVSNISKFKLLNKEINQMIKLYLTFLLAKKSYLAINFIHFQNKVFLNNFLINYFAEDSYTISKKMNFYTFVYDLTNLRINNNLFSINNLFTNNIYLFFTRRCYLYAKLSISKNNFSIYEKNVKKMKLVMRYIDKLTFKRYINSIKGEIENFDDISKRVYNEVSIIK